ncbi:ATP-binding cassette domain-containing protein [Flavobacterium sp. AJR]|uniref:ATP-binding cassette domain-containing protein n=1 Tax=Flavobacterium sp. AJR TaxID=1979369 RepID=UPI000A3D804D|nr:ATP-binding cassette domain-containing protein [Flavobacterium sp. AJR]OUL63977.1 ABC transporter [Flavobacterium sp. AJR]
MKRHILEIDSVKKSFGEKIILSDVYLQCETNDIIGLLGRNGSGKSTFLKIIFGVIPADFKFVRIDGVMKIKIKELMNEISYLSQDNFIPNVFSVKKAIRLSIAKERIDSFCNDEMIQVITDKKIAHLSGGELRYLEIKLVLENSSKFVLLDEPYNGLSPLMIEKVNQLIIMNSSKKGIIISDHNYRNVISISTRLVLIKDGKLNHVKDKNELIEKGYLSPEMI